MPLSQYMIAFLSYNIKTAKSLVPMHVCVNLDT